MFVILLVSLIKVLKKYENDNYLYYKIINS